MDNEAKAGICTVIFLAALALPWVYTIDRKLFEALMILALVILGVIVAVFIILGVYALFLAFFNRDWR